MALRHLALSYQIVFITPNKFDMTRGDWLFGVCLFSPRRAIGAIDFGPGGTPPNVAGRRAALGPRKFCGKLIGPYPSPAYCGACGTIQSFGSCRGGYLMEKLMRTYILAIATAALFAIPTAAFSEDIHIGPGGVRIGPSYGHHRLYNRDEGGRCAEMRQACLHKGQLGEQGMGNCQRYRAMCR
jgi:hypothetical protein